MQEGEKGRHSRVFVPAVRCRWIIPAVVLMLLGGIVWVKWAAAAALPVLAAAGCCIWAAVLMPEMAYDSFSYDVTAERIRICRGVLWRRQVLIPTAQVECVQRVRGPLSRCLGTGTLVLTTSAGRVILWFV